jgi:hypothetical protein
MRVVRGLLIALFIPLWAACGCGAFLTPDASTAAAFFDECPSAQCAAPTPVHADTDLAAGIAAAPWPRKGPYTTGCLAASGDLRVDGSLTFDAGAIAVPAECAGGCLDRVSFRLVGAPAGVSCVAMDPAAHLGTCATVRVTDATVRVRPIIQDTHASPTGNFAPVVEILGACASPCAASELACPASHTCYGSERDFCAYCLGGDNQTCACWTPSGQAVDRTTCHLYLGDIMVTGTCQAGACAY